ncbi:UNVERIFIED_CONTAM: hypothetical protein Sindi_2498400 [Sesamum indicum]
MQRREFLMKILDKCDNGPKRINPKLLKPGEKQEWLRNFEVRQVLPENVVRRIHSTEVHGRIPVRRNGTELESDTSKISQDLIKIQKIVQDYGHRLIHRPMKIKSLSQKVDEVLKILPDLHKGLTDLKAEITDLKRNQRESPETSRSRQERIRDALGTVPLLHQKGKATEIPKPKADLSYLQELAESFSQLGIVDLVNIQTNEITPALPPPEGSTCSNDPPQDQPMRDSADFHTNATPTLVKTRLKENSGRNPKRVPENTPWARTMLQPLHPYGAILNLDIIDFRNIEKLIDEWVAAIKIAATTLELDKENFIKLVELSLDGSVKIGWDNTPEDTKASILVGDSKGAIADRLGRFIKIHFIGDGYFKGSRAEKAREYAQALFSLELRSICAVDEYIYWFHKYFFQSGVATEVAAPIFFAKICSPWREMLIQSYKVPEGQLDLVARRMSFLKDKLTDWCYKASIQKNMKRLRGKIKRTPFCCDNNDFPTVIGESSEPMKRRKQNSDSYPRISRRTFSWRISWWSKSKARTYKSGQRTGLARVSSQGSRRTDARSTGRTPTRRTFRRARTRTNESFKDCNCWTCGAKGHISPDCPQKRGELRKFEATDDILDVVYYGDLVPIYQFEDLPSDESVYEEEIETDSDGSSIESE